MGKSRLNIVKRMYHLLDLYQLPYNRDEPVVCVDEKSKQLLASTQPDLPLKPGQVIKIDDEYERKGTRNLFVAVEPLAGWRQVQVTTQRKQILLSSSDNCCKGAPVAPSASI